MIVGGVTWSGIIVEIYLSCRGGGATAVHPAEVLIGWLVDWFIIAHSLIYRESRCVVKKDLHAQGYAMETLAMIKETRERGEDEREYEGNGSDGNEKRGSEEEGRRK